MKKLLLTLTTLVIIGLSNLVNGQAPNWLWAKSAAGNNYGGVASVASDASGNVFMTGYFDSPTITFGTTTLINSGYDDIFIVKYDSSGNVLWAKKAGGNSYDEGFSVSTDGGGNVFMTGMFQSPTITFGATTLTNGGDFDIFIVKYDSSGNVLWAKSEGSTSEDAGRSVSTDTSGNVIISGNFYSPTITFGTITLTHTGQADIFIAKYDASGNVLWARKAAGTGDDYSYSVCTDAGGNVFVTGFFDAPSITFGAITLTSSGYNDIFLAKYDSSGNVLWAKKAGGTYTESGYSVSTDGSGNVFISGYFSSPSISFGTTTLTNAGPANYSDVFIAKYDSSGNVLWAKKAGSTGYEDGNSVCTDGSGNVFISGYFSSPSITFGTTTLTNAGPANYADIFIAKYDASGNMLWADGEGSTGSEYGNSISTDANGNVFMVGFFSSTITFGTTTLTNAGGSSYSYYIAKLPPFCSSSSSISPDACNSYTSPSGNYNWTTSGIYTDTLINSGGCDSIIFINLTINTVNTSVTQTGNVLTASATGATYQWLDCNNNFAIINGATNQIFAPTAIGIYAASITINGCTDTSGCIAVIGVGISELSLINNFEIYPNPANDLLVINYPTLAGKDVTVSIRDIAGKMLYNKTLTATQKMKVNTRDFDAGVYLVQLLTKDFVETKKVIVEKN